MTLRALPFADRRVRERLREGLLLVLVAGVAALGARLRLELRVLSAVRDVAGEALAARERRVDVLLRAPGLRLLVAPGAEGGALCLQELLRGRGVRIVAGRALALGRGLVDGLDGFLRQLFREIVAGAAEVFLGGDEKRLAVTRVRRVAGGAGSLERIVDDGFLEVGLAVLVAVEAERGIGLRQRERLPRLGLRVARRALGRGSVDDGAEQLLAFARVRRMAGRAGELLDGEAGVQPRLRGAAGTVAGRAQLLDGLRKQGGFGGGVGVVAGQAALRGRLVDALAREGLALVAREAGFVSIRLEETLEVGSVRRVARGARGGLAVLRGLERRVDVGELESRLFLLVAREAEAGLFFLEDERAHDAVPLVTRLAALPVPEGSVNEFLCVLFCDGSVAVEARLARRLQRRS